MYSVHKIFNIPYEMWVVEINCDKEDCVDFNSHSGVIEIRGETEELVKERAKVILKALNKKSVKIVSRAKEKSDASPN